MRRIGLLALFAIVAAADNDPSAQVKRLADEGRKAEAVRLAGGWIADAQKRDDLIEEEAAWNALREIPLDGAEYRDACAEVMKLLDPKRSGAYLSAHLLALELLRATILENDDRHLADAVKVLGTPRREWGACGPALADLAKGVALARKEDDKAGARLAAALDLALKNGWLDLATHAGIELACAEKKAGREGDALKRLDEALKENGDRSLLQLRNALARSRIPESVIELPGGGVAAAGGRGGRGGPTESAVGRAWKALPAKKPFLEIKRGKTGFEIEPLFAGAKKDERPFDTGVRHWDDGGITLSFYGTGVSLAMVDLTGRRGQPGESSQPRPWQLFHPLAQGETWSVTKQGVSVGK